MIEFTVNPLRDITVTIGDVISVEVEIGAVINDGSGSSPASGSGIELTTSAEFATHVLPAHDDNARFTLLVTGDFSQVVTPAGDESFILPNGVITTPGQSLTLQTGSQSVIGAYLDIIDVPGTVYRLINMMRGTWLAG